MSNLGRLITNKRGDYLWLTSTDTSRFQGWFLRFHDNLIKIVDNLEATGAKSLNEKFSLATHNPVLYYEISSPQFIIIDLDIRFSYSNPKWDRNFEIEQDNDKIIIFYKHTKSKGDEFESSSDRVFSDYPCLPAGRRVSTQRLSALAEFCVVLKMPQKSFFARLRRWVKKEYPYDKNRNSPPVELYVFRPLKVKASSLSITAAPTKERALANLHYAKKSSPVLIRKKKKVKRKNNPDLLKGISCDSDLAENVLRHEILNQAKNRSQNSLFKLLVFKNGSKNTESIKSSSSVSLQAGLPWFFQTWSRDELISLKGLASVDSRVALDILKRNLNRIKPDGRLPNIQNTERAQGENESADAIGWLFSRAGEFLAKDNNSFPHHSQFSVKDPLEVSLRGLLKEHTDADGFAICGTGETWMDAVYKGDERAGVRLEVQALRLNMYRLAYELTQKKRYKKLERKLKRKVQKFFWTGDYLQDGKEDPTIRPNIFLAYYLYPKLLSKEQWRSCFDKALKHLWCDWQISESSVSEQSERLSAGYQCFGGLASIDKNHPLFCPEHTGEDPKSYHRGDSWFWVNNLAAVAMLRLDSVRYKDCIQKITNASVVDLFGGQIPGHASELSSASTFSPDGSPYQAWSEATLIELIDEIEEQGFGD